MSRPPFPTRAMIARIVEINERLARQEIAAKRGLAYDRLMEEQARFALNLKKETGK